MENLSHFGSDDLAEVHNQDNVTHNVINQAVQAMPLFEQSNIVNQSETQITIDSNIISYSRYKAQQLKPKLYDGSIIQKTNAIVIRDLEETLMLAEESHSKMLLKQKDPMMSEKKVNTKQSKKEPLPQPSLRARGVQNVFYQMEHAVEQHGVESTGFQAKMNKVLNESERLLKQAISKDIVNIVVTSTVNNACEPVHECERCVKLETELQKDFVKRESYDKLFK
uniref:Uncharacterized protein n=1 Tax=Tanacetum cinerariifolium TaxID=118510 RepID=A0A6L2LE56_TANCI|nr:hypothetical protein [Tanacetum cinerariifolium]